MNSMNYNLSNFATGIPLATILEKWSNFPESVQYSGLAL